MAIIGAGPGCLALMDMIFKDRFGRLHMNLVGVADRDLDAAGLQLARACGVYTTSDYHTLFEIPDLNLIIELTGREELSLAVQREKPAHVRLVPYDVAALFGDFTRLQDEKRSAEKRYKDLFENAREGLALFDAQGAILESNFSLALMLGYSKRELEAKRISELAGDISARILGEHLDGLKILGFTAVELDFVRKNGAKVPVEADISWLPEEKLFRIMLRDITIQKKLEQSRRTYAEGLEKEVQARTDALKASETEARRQKRTAEGIISGSPIPMFVLDQDHKVIYWNRACESLTGYSAEKMVGTDGHWKPFYAQKRPLLADLIIDGDEEKIRELYSDMDLRRSSMVEGAYEAEAHFAGLGAEGTYLYFNAAPIRDESGGIQGSIVTYQDLREIRKLQKEKEQAQRMAAIGKTVAGVAHYIKNILMGLQGGAYVVQSAVDKQNLKLVAKGWDMVERNIEQIGTIVTDMLIYSSDRRPKYSDVRPNDLARELLESMQERARLAGVKLTADLGPDLPAVSMDRTALHRCLLNLVSNAVDACTLEGIVDGKGIVTVKTDRPAGWGVRFQVKDNGTGMDAATQQKLFTDFFTTKGYKGTGLGLPVTQKIVEEHGGELTFTSKVGQGTKFTLLLPEKK